MKLIKEINKMISDKIKILANQHKKIRKNHIYDMCLYNDFYKKSWLYQARECNLALIELKIEILKLFV